MFVASDIARSFIVDSLKFLDHLITLVYTKPKLSGISTPLSSTGDAATTTAHNSKGGNSDPPSLRELLEDITRLLQYRLQDPPQAGYTVTQMIDEFTTFVKASAQEEENSYAPWIGFTNAALFILRDIGNKKFRPVNSEHDIIMQCNDSSRLHDSDDEMDERKPDAVLVNLSLAKSHSKKPGAQWLELPREQVKNYSGAKDSENWNWIDIKLVCEFGNSTADLEDDYAACEKLKSLHSFEFDLEGLVLHKPNLPKLPLFPKFPEIKPTHVPPLESSFDDAFPEQISTSESPEPTPKKRKVSQTVGGGCEDVGINQEPPHKKRYADKHTQELSQGDSYAGAHAEGVAEPAIMIEEDVTQNVFVQPGEHLMAMLCSSPLMTHAHALVLKGRILHVMRADRSGVIITQGFNVVKNMHLYLALLFIFQRFDERDCGIYVPLKHETVKVGEIEFTEENIYLHRPWGITGRCSTIQVYSRQTDDSEVAVKFSWPLQNRKSEYVCLEEAWTKFCGTRDNFNPKVFGHIPRVLGYLRRDDTNTQRIREAFGCDQGVPRHLSLLVTPRYEGTIRQLCGHRFAKVIKDCIHAHYFLWKENICHGDISDGNLLWRGLDESEKVRYIKKSGDNEQVRKAADDFVFGIDLVLEPATPSQQPTGTTWQFMSNRLLTLAGRSHSTQAPVHYHLDDIESFMWVLVIDTATLPDWIDCWMTRRYLGWGKTTPPDECGTHKSEWFSARSWIHNHTPTRRHQETWAILLWLVECVVGLRKEEKALGDGVDSHAPSNLAAEMQKVDIIYSKLLSAMGV